MAFQGNTFLREQNFTRDRDLGPPENTISAEKMDDEFDNFANGLSAVKQLGETAKSTAEAAPGAIRGGVTEDYDTLKKLFDWANATLAPKALFELPAAARAGFFLRVHSSGAYYQALSPADARVAIGALPNNQDGTTSGNIEIRKTAPSLWLHDPAIKRARWVLDTTGLLVWQDQNGQSHFYITPTGAVWTQQIGDLATYVNNTADNYATTRAKSQGDDARALANQKATSEPAGRCGVHWNGSDPFFRIDTTYIQIARRAEIDALSNATVRNVRLVEYASHGATADAGVGRVVVGVNAGNVYSRLLQFFTPGSGWQNALQA